MEGKGSSQGKGLLFVYSLKKSLASLPPRAVFLRRVVVLRGLGSSGSSRAKSDGTEKRVCLHGHFSWLRSWCISGDGIDYQTLSPVCSYYTHRNPLKLPWQLQSSWSCKSRLARYNCPTNKNSQKFSKTPCTLPHPSLNPILSFSS